MDELRKMDGELLDYLGFNRKEDSTYPSSDYDETFYTISGGEYANTLFAQFGKARVEAELEDPSEKVFC